MLNKKRKVEVHDCLGMSLLNTIIVGRIKEYNCYLKRCYNDKSLLCISRQISAQKIGK